MEYFVYFIIYLLIFLMGASVFSFVNVVAYRMPRGLNFVNDRSMCPECEHKLGALDLIPIFSYIFLRGRCRYCKTKISIRYFLMEVLGGALFLITFLRFGYTIESILYFIFFSILVVVFIIDKETMEIPNKLVLAIFILSILIIIIDRSMPISHRLIGFFIISVPMLLLSIIINGAFGGGDIKLMAASGLILGFKISLVSTFIAILAGGVYGAYLLIAKKAGGKSHFAFGPFLCVGMIVGVLYGTEILNWYLKAF